MKYPIFLLFFFFFPSRRGKSFIHHRKHVLLMCGTPRHFLGYSLNPLNLLYGSGSSMETSLRMPSSLFFCWCYLFYFPASCRHNYLELFFAPLASTTISLFFIYHRRKCIVRHPRSQPCSKCRWGYCFWPSWTNIVEVDHLQTEIESQCSWPGHALTFAILPQWLPVGSLDDSALDYNL